MKTKIISKLARPRSKKLKKTNPKNKKKNNKHHYRKQTKTSYSNPKAELVVQIELPDAKFARTVYGSVQPETERVRTYRSNVNLNIISGNKLQLRITAADIVALRAATNSIMRLIMVAMKTVHVLAPFYTAKTLAT